MKKREREWEIHVVSDSCEQEGCDYHEDTFLPFMCDAHTHGLDKFGSPELQLVLNLDLHLVGYILNTVGDMVRDGLVLEDGMEITGLFEGEASLKTFFTEDRNGVKICRLILPDTEFRFPEESEEYPYNKQLESPYKAMKAHSGRYS